MYYLGMMSGTSLDGIDAVLAEHTANGWRIVHHTETPMPTTLKAQLLALNTPQPHDEHGELHAALVAEQQLTRCYADTYHRLIQQSGINPNHVAVIGAHGQTIRHDPNSKTPYTVQLLDGALLSQLTQNNVVCDFRRKDIAAGGQGAPLAPLFHQALFDLSPPFAVVNIGGISNISLIAEPNGTTGFDCGPGNCLLDEWIHLHVGKAFDKNGHWASQGEVLPPLLDTLLADPYFALPTPKSTGRDYFNQQWLMSQLNHVTDHVTTHVETHVQSNIQPHVEKPEDVMRTLVALTAKTIADCIPETTTTAVIVGGGAKNPLLLKDIQNYAPHTHVVSSDTLNINPQQVEALGFAILGKTTLSQTHVDTRLITGAKQPVILGAVYYCRAN